jgi:hypothetical protein
MAHKSKTTSRPSSLAAAAVPLPGPDECPLNSSVILNATDPSATSTAMPCRWYALLAAG